MDNFDPQTESRVGATAWARSVLGLPQDGTPGDARKVLIRQLQAHHFRPPVESFTAYQILESGTAKQLKGCELAVAEAKVDAFLVDATLEFAKSFFELPPTERRVRWVELYQNCQEGDSARARLKQLEAGLDAELPNETGNSDCDVWVLCIREIFVLDPWQRPIATRKWRSRFNKEPEKWESAAQTFRKRYPKTKMLLPEFVDEFAERTLRQRQNFKKARALSRRRKVATVINSIWSSEPVRSIAIVAAMIGIGWTILFFVSDPKSGGRNRTSPKTPIIAITPQQANAWFELSDEQLMRSGGMTLLILTKKAELRREYRKALDELAKRRPGLRPGFEDDPEEVELFLSEREKLERQLMLWMWQMESEPLRAKFLQGFYRNEEGSPEGGRMEGWPDSIRKRIARKIGMVRIRLKYLRDAEHSDPKTPTSGTIHDSSQKEDR